MRHIRHRPLLASFVLIALAGRSAAQEPGDIVVASRDTQLKIGERVVAEIPQASTLRVEKVSDKWLWVRRGGAGWVLREHVAPLDEALRYLTAQIMDNPGSTVALNARASVYFETGSYRNAIADFNRAIELDEDNAVLHANRGIAHFQTGGFDQAIADLSRAIELNPREASFRTDRGWVYHQQGEYGLAAADYAQALSLQPGSPAALANQAWLWSTCPQEELRNGQRAVEAARRACEASDWNYAFALGALAAAHAELGDFETAIGRQEEALAKAPPSKAKEYQHRLESYQKQQPWREVVDPDLGKDADADSTTDEPDPDNETEESLGPEAPQADSPIDG